MSTNDRFEDRDLKLPSGRVRVRLRGPAEGRPVLLAAGLSANLVCFDVLGLRLAAAGFRAVAYDARGRGFSEATAPGTYGWPAHARDVLAIADRLGAARFDMAGWSMGGGVAMELARLAPERLRRVALIDVLGPVDEAVAAAVRMSVDRLGSLYPSLPEYVSTVRALGLVEPWSETWERYFAYEMEPVEGGVRSRTQKAAVMEDFEYALDLDLRRLWPDLTMPVLLVRALRPMHPELGGVLVPPEVLAEFCASHPSARAVEVDANHYSVGTDGGVADAITAFLSEG